MRWLYWAVLAGYYLFSVAAAILTVGFAFFESWTYTVVAAVTALLALGLGVVHVHEMLRSAYIHGVVVTADTIKKARGRSVGGD